MRIKASVYCISVIMLLCTFQAATQTLTGAMSFLGNHHLTPVYTPSMSVSASKNCLTIATGISTLHLSVHKSGIFDPKCRETAPVSSINEELLRWTIYPNPANDYTTVKTNQSGDLLSVVRIRIYAADGKTVFSRSTTMGAIAGGYTIATHAWSTGVYICVIEAAGKSYQLRLVRVKPN